MMTNDTRTDIILAVADLRAVADDCAACDEQDSADELRALAARLEILACGDAECA